jgi:hypothetical protein
LPRRLQLPRSCPLLRLLTQRPPKSARQLAGRSTSTKKTARSISIGRHQSWPGWRIICARRFGKYGTLSHRVVLFLNSAGGQVEEGDRVIQILNEAKQTHRLITQVLDGNLCASMCIPIFLQGDDRFAARASNWIFHEATRPGANGKERTDITWCLFLKYYVPGRGPDGLAQEYRAHHSTREPVANR